MTTSHHYEGAAVARRECIHELLGKLADTHHLVEVVHMLDRLYPVLEEQFRLDRGPDGEHAGIDLTVPSIANRGRALLAEQPELLRRVIDARTKALAARDALGTLAHLVRHHEAAEVELSLDSTYFEVGVCD